MRNPNAKKQRRSVSGEQKTSLLVLPVSNGKLYEFTKNKLPMLPGSVGNFSQNNTMLLFAPVRSLNISPYNRGKTGLLRSSAPTLPIYNTNLKYKYNVYSKGVNIAARKQRSSLSAGGSR